MGAPFGDYLLVDYSVSCDEAQIRLRARRVDPGEPRMTMLLFRGVVAYHFKDDNFGTILLYVIEDSLEAFLRLHEVEFATGFARAGWPGFWTGSLDEALAKLGARGIRAYRISSAIGMSGWVLASSFETLAEDVHVL